MASDISCHVWPNCDLVKADQYFPINPVEIKDLSQQDGQVWRQGSCAFQTKGLSSGGPTPRRQVSKPNLNLRAPIMLHYLSSWYTAHAAAQSECILHDTFQHGVFFEKGRSKQPMEIQVGRSSWYSCTAPPVLYLSINSLQCDPGGILFRRALQPSVTQTLFVYSALKQSWTAHRHSSLQEISCSVRCSCSPEPYQQLPLVMLSEWIWIFQSLAHFQTSPDEFHTILKVVTQQRGDRSLAHVRPLLTEQQSG